MLEVTLARELFPEQNTRLGIVGIIMMMIKRMMMTIIIIINSDFQSHYIGQMMPMKIFDEKPEEESEKESDDERGDSSGHRDHHHLGD